MLSHIKHTEKGDSFRIMFDSLVRWRNMQECMSEQTGPVLDDLMQQFNKLNLQPNTQGMHEIHGMGSFIG